MYKPGTTGPVELGEKHWYTGTWYDQGKRRYFLYVQLWVNILRNFWGITPYTPKKELNEPKPEVRQANVSLEHYFGRLAVHSGFETDIAKDWSCRNVVEDLVEQWRPDIELGFGKFLDSVKLDLAAALLNSIMGLPG
jgi:nitrogen fixation protein